MFTAILVLAFVFPTKSQMSVQNGINGITDLVAGRNVNMVSEDTYRERQNEPSLAVSTINTDHLLAGANDYTTVAMASQQPTIGITEDAWLGVFKSFDGGESWTHELMPGSSKKDPSPLLGFDAAADPTVRAGIGGAFFYSGIAFDRKRNGDSVIFVSRWQDQGTKNDISFEGITIIDQGTSGQFSDKPWLAVDVPRPGFNYPDGVVYIIYSIFLGEIDKNIHSKIMLSRSIDGGQSWEKPIKVSEGQQKNQGTIVAIDPNDGTVYIAWRRFAATNAMDAILIAKSEDFGQTFTKAEEVALIPRPFDQSSVGIEFGPTQFRTQVYPAMAIDHTGRVYLAWSQRDVDALKYDDARIVLTSFEKEEWSFPRFNIEAVESPFMYVDPSTGERIGKPVYDGSGEVINKEYIQGHQFMPTLSFAAGKLIIAWYDSRFSERYFDAYGNPRNDPGEYGEPLSLGGADRIMDIPGGSSTLDPALAPYESKYRETLDVRTAQAAPGPSPNWEPSVQTSRYVWFLEGDETNYKIRQGQFNPPNYPLFSDGTVPFHGDYLDIAPAPLFIEDIDGWRFNTGYDPYTNNPNSDPFLFYVSWTDNRDVLPPYSELPTENPWRDYNLADPCEKGMRNQNIYVSKIMRGVEVGIRGDFVKNISGEDTHIFVIYVNNQTGSPFEVISEKIFKVLIKDQTQTASFFPDELPEDPPPGTTEQTVFVDVPDHSAISRMVFVPYGFSFPLEIEVYEVTGAGETYIDSVFLRPKSLTPLSGRTAIAEEALINWDLANPEYNTFASKDILNPNILSPNIINPNILSPNILSPNILSPNILSPNIINPNIINPNILSPNILSPNILSPNILSTPENPVDVNAVVDKVWTVANNTESVTSHTFKSIAGETFISEQGILVIQLLVFKVHYLSDTPLVPSFTDCILRRQVQHELLVNITPDIISDVDPGQIRKILGDPQTEIENATFSLNPGDEALVILRFIHTDKVPRAPAQGILSETARLSQLSTEVQEYADTFGGVVVSHDSTEDTYDISQNDLTLMILPASLPDGQAGKSYPDSLNPDDFVTIRAIGGEKIGEVYDYTWSVTGYPAGFSWMQFEDPDSLFGDSLKIYGFPRESGSFSLTVRVTDNATTAFKERTFNIIIYEPDPLVIVPVPDPHYSATIGVDFNGLTFTATGGVPDLEGAALYSWTVTGLPAGLNYSLNSDGSMMEISGTPVGPVANFTVTLALNDAYLGPFSEAHPRPVIETFDICVLPPEPFDLIPYAYAAGNEVSCEPDSSIDVCALPDGSLGADYGQNNVRLIPQNNASGTVLTWEIVSGDLPPGIEFLPSLAAGPVTGPASIDIVGTPTFQLGQTYPKTYSVLVGVTESWDYGENCSGDRYAEKELTIKINPKLPLWTFEGTSSADAVAVTADETSGNTYVTGYTEGATTGTDFFTAVYVYNPDTKEVTEKSIPFVGPGADAPSDIAIYEGIIYVTGTSEGDNTGPDIYTAAYDFSQPAEQEIIWEMRYDGPSHMGDGAYAIAVDSGYVYVAGYVHRGNKKAHADYVTIKMNRMTGEIVWDETYDSRRNGKDFATAIAVDAEKNVYVTGKSEESLTKEETTFDFCTIKYSSSGRLLWEARDDGPGFGGDEPTAILIGPGGNIYVTGQTTGETDGADYFTVKYDSEGNRLWGMTYNGPGLGDDIPSGIAVDAAGTVYVTGKSIGDDFDFATVIYNSYGQEQDVLRYDSGIGYNDEAVGVFVDSLGFLVAGTIMDDPNDVVKSDIFVIQYVPSGDMGWIAQYDGSAGLDDVATDMIVTSTGIFVTGYSINSSGEKVIFILAFEK